MGRPKEDRYKVGNEMLAIRMFGHVRVNGAGDVKSYVEKEFGMNYRTYLRRAKEPETITIGMMRTIADRCSLSDSEILRIFGR